MGQRSLHLLCFAAILLLTACDPTPASKSTNAGHVNISQDGISSARVKPVDGLRRIKVVALANGSAEIVAAMGLGNILVGRDVASSEKALESVPIVTSGHQVIPEKIIALHPDLVLVDSSTGPSAALEVLKKSGIVLKDISEAWTLADIARKVSQVGIAIGAPKTAALLNLQMSAAITKSFARSKIKPRVAFLYLRGTSSIYLMGGPGSGADSLLRAVGAIDVGAQSLPHAFNSLTSEALVSANPDILLVMTKGLESVGGVSGLMSLPGVAQTSAGKKHRVISVDDSLLLSFGPRTPDLLARLSSAVTEVMKS